MRLLGLAGYARAGKDTAARALAPLGFTRIALADALRDFVYAAADPWLRTTVDAVGWEHAKATVPGIRERLQQAGTAARDILGADVWIRAAFARMRPDGSYAVPDVRFPNEAAAMRAAGGKLVRIVRPGVAPANDHISERALDGFAAWDAVLVNDGTPEDLAARIRDWVRVAWPEPAPTVRILKILPRFFDAVVAGTKRAEIRREDDCRFEAGDVLDLREWDGTAFTGRRAGAVVTHVLREAPYVPPGYAALSIRLLSEPEPAGQTNAAGPQRQ